MKKRLRKQSDYMIASSSNMDRLSAYVQELQLDGWLVTGSPFYQPGCKEIGLVSQALYKENVMDSEQIRVELRKELLNNYKFRGLCWGLLLLGNAATWFSRDYKFWEILTIILSAILLTISVVEYFVYLKRVGETYTNEY